MIVRLGNLQATAGIANVRLDTGKDGNSVVSVDLAVQAHDRPGESTYVKAGIKQPIAICRRPSPSIPRSTA